MTEGQVFHTDLSPFSRSLIENSRDCSHQASIAVLPFADRDEESRKVHTGRWLADDVSHHLSRFRTLSVMGNRASVAAGALHERSSNFVHSLGTRYVATGSVRRQNHGLTAEIRLIDTASGQQRWRAPYCLEQGHSSDLEDDLANLIATGLAMSIDALERERITSENLADQAPSSDATPLILMADHLTKQFQRHANERAKVLLRKALRLDPASARVHAVLSRTHHLDGRYGWTADPEAAIESAIELAELAINLDPLEAWGYAEIGMNRHFQKDYDCALAAYQRALEINPNDPDILADFSDYLISDGAPERAIEALGMAIHLRPERADMYRYYLAGAFDQLGDDETIVRLLSMGGDNQEGHRLMAASCIRLGRADKAAYHADLALKAHPDFSLVHWRSVLPHRDPDTRERIIEGMERAGFH